MESNFGKIILAIVFIIINILFFVIMPLNAFEIVVDGGSNLGYQFTTLLNKLFNEGLGTIYSWFGLAYLLTLLFSIINISIGIIILLNKEIVLFENKPLSRAISLVNTFIASLPIILTIIFQLISVDKADQLWWYSFFSISNILVWGIIKIHYDIKTGHYKVDNENQI